MHRVTQQIIELLEQDQMWFEKFEHQPVRTSEEAAAIRDGYTLDQGAKALIVRIKVTNSQKFFVMLVLSGSDKFDAAKVNTYLGSKDIRFATQVEADQITGGVEFGGVPPFGNLFGLKVLCDPKVLNFERIIFNAGDKSISIGMKSVDYVKLVKPEVVEIV